MATIIKVTSEFFRKLVAVRWYWRVWLAWLIAVNLAAAVVIAGEAAMWWIFAALSSGAILGIWLYHRQGFTKLLGLMHLPWIPMTFVQWTAYQGAESGSKSPILLAAVMTNLDQPRRRG